MPRKVVAENVTNAAVGINEKEALRKFLRKHGYKGNRLVAEQDEKEKLVIYIENWKPDNFAMRIRQFAQANGFSVVFE